ncbi:MAG TPA: FKBP-type peptidyl-prolyl cis-trans isomerase [Sediminibacterium sp.]|nr:FKBP-type peptidyl-prolyl cis-trans isomerase [Sediminibacterium sp.]
MMRTIAALLIGASLLASCNQYDKTPTGMAYKITHGGGKALLKNGEFVKFNILYKIASRDTTLIDSYKHIPAYIMVDTARPTKHSFLEVITKCAVGDKIDFMMSVDSLKNLGLLQFNETFHPRDMITGKVEFLKSFPNQQEATLDYQKEMENEKDREVKELKDFVKNKGIKTVATPSGALVEVTNPGDSYKADTGTQARVLYRGTFLNGKEFETNMKGPNQQPLHVIIGQNTVIPGMDEGLRLFGKGGKGKIYVPAMLAYGQGGNPPVIPAFANLVFEVELVDVSKADPTPAQGLMVPHPAGK